MSFLDFDVGALGEGLDPIGGMPLEGMGGLGGQPGGDLGAGLGDPAAQQLGKQPPLFTQPGIQGQQSGLGQRGTNNFMRPATTQETQTLLGQGVGQPPALPPAGQPQGPAAPARPPEPPKPPYMSVVKQIESAGGLKTATPGKSARGLYGFQPATWKQYGAKYGNLGDTHAEDLGMAALTRDYGTQLTRLLGRAPTDQERYLAHQQGPTGAALLITNLDRPAGNLVNPSHVSGNGGDPNASARDFIAKISQRYDQNAAKLMGDGKGEPISGDLGQGGQAAQNPDFYVPGFKKSLAEIPLGPGSTGQAERFPQTPPGMAYNQKTGGFVPFPDLSGVNYSALSGASTSREGAVMVDNSLPGQGGPLGDQPAVGSPLSSGPETPAGLANKVIAGVEADKASRKALQAQKEGEKAPFIQQGLAAATRPLPPLPHYERAPDYDQWKAQHNKGVFDGAGGKALVLGLVGGLAAAGMVFGRHSYGHSMAGMAGLDGFMKGLVSGHKGQANKGFQEYEASVQALKYNNSLVDKEYDNILNNNKLEYTQQVDALKIVATKYEDKEIAQALDSKDTSTLDAIRQKRRADEEKIDEDLKKAREVKERTEYSHTKDTDRRLVADTKTARKDEDDEQKKVGPLEAKAANEKAATGNVTLGTAKALDAARQAVQAAHSRYQNALRALSQGPLSHPGAAGSPSSSDATPPVPVQDFETPFNRIQRAPGSPEGKKVQMRDPEAQSPSDKTGSAPTVTSQEQFDALPAGAEFLDARGQPHRKN